MKVGSLFNHLMDNSKSVTPKVGDGGTLLMWTDRHAGTILWVSEDGKTLKWTPDKCTRNDKNGMSDSQSYTYETVNSIEKSTTFTLRKNGKWIAKGQTMKGNTLSIGHRSEYYDYSF